MNQLFSWLEAHDKLAGWAQFLGAILALLLTYFTAFWPMWRRKHQLRNAAQRLLLNGFEAIESYHRTSQHFLPFALSLKAAMLSMNSVAEEIDRFPIYELDNQGSRSPARNLIAVAVTLKGIALFLEPIASELDTREGSIEDQENIRLFVGDRLKFVTDMLTGAELKRPEWPLPSSDGEINAS